MRQARAVWARSAALLAGAALADPAPPPPGRGGLSLGVLDLEGREVLDARVFLHMSEGAQRMTPWGSEPPHHYRVIIPARWEQGPRDTVEGEVKEAEESRLVLTLSPL